MEPSVVISVAAGALLKRILELKFGNYDDPNNLLEEALGKAAADVGKELIIEAILAGGRYVIQQVLTSEPISIDPELEREMDQRIDLIRSKMKSRRQHDKLSRAAQLRVFSDVRKKVKQLEVILCKKSYGYSSNDDSNEPFAVTFVKLALRRLGLTSGGWSRYQIMFDTTSHEEITISVHAPISASAIGSNHVEIEPDYIGGIAVSTCFSLRPVCTQASNDPPSGSALSLKQLQELLVMDDSEEFITFEDVAVYSDAGPAVKYIKDVCDLFVGAIEHQRYEDDRWREIQKHF